MHRTSIPLPTTYSTPFYAASKATPTPGSTPAPCDTGIGKTAADITVLTGTEHPTQLAREPAPLHIDRAKSASPEDHSNIHTLRTDLTFDETVRASTQIYHNVISDYETNAHNAFIKDQTLRGTGHLKNYAAFKDERRAALSSSKKNPIDVSKSSSYQELSNNRRLAARSAFDPLDGDSPMEKYLPPGSKFRRALEPELGSVRDIRTGLNAQLVRSEGRPRGTPDRYILAFPGTGVVNSAGKQWLTNITQFLGIGGVPKMYRQALELAQEIQQQLPDGCKLELCGHSLGGGIASYVGLSLGMKAVGFNSSPLGADCIKALRKAGALTPDRLENLTQIRTEGDPVTSRTVNTLLTRLASSDALSALRVPQLPGKV